MQRETPDLIEERCNAVVAAVSRARETDNIQCAFSVAATSLVIVGDDPRARSALARFLVDLVRELDSDALRVASS